MAHVERSDRRAYFARAVEGLDRDAVISESAVYQLAFEAHGLNVVDPILLAHESGFQPGPSAPVSAVRELVEFELGLLRSCQVVVCDMTIPDRNYVGCISELTYAKMWSIPSYVATGRSGNEKRLWLRYLAAGLVDSVTEAIAHAATPSPIA